MATAEFSTSRSLRRKKEMVIQLVCHTSSFFSTCMSGGGGRTEPEEQTAEVPHIKTGRARMFQPSFCQQDFLQCTSETWFLGGWERGMIGQGDLPCHVWLSGFFAAANIHIPSLFAMQCDALCCAGHMFLVLDAPPRFGSPAEASDHSSKLRISSPQFAVCPAPSHLLFRSGMLRGLFF